MNDNDNPLSYFNNTDILPHVISRSKRFLRALIFLEINSKLALRSVPLKKIQEVSREPNCARTTLKQILELRNSLIDEELKTKIEAHEKLKIKLLDEAN